jgi:hypothetical protein
MAVRKLLSFVVVSAFLSGCSVAWNGHPIPLDKFDQLEAGKTTPEKVQDLLGPPEDILVRPMENIMVFVYRSVVQTTVGLGIPGFIIGVGRGKQNGYTVNVTFRDDLLVSYEMTQLGQNLLWRKKK